MQHFLYLCFEDDENDAVNHDDNNSEQGLRKKGSPDGDDNDKCSKMTEGGPVLWLMKRLSNISKNKGEKRSESVFKCFSSFCTDCEGQFVILHLKLMIELLHRATHEIENGDQYSNL
eukprot:CAMPEP_0194373910 /NCGR_PEP_ID=MMETSP0174-20130528/22300_1 /TAXON_ID=216777 /ORGANISM="Proboscia alata, Strain PI-D3" /LENGTH=116 /DNA_ID=CAMNT_0039153195 /DNA_START=695 /DNA_END=1045 /DNA_ORIENTATION=-